MGGVFFLAPEEKDYAEDADQGFMPQSGEIALWQAPPALRVEHALGSGGAIPPYYDSMIAKLIVHGANRNECLMRLRRALSEYVIDGLETIIPLHKRLINEPTFINGDYDIHWLQNFVDGGGDNGGA